MKDLLDAAFLPNHQQCRARQSNCGRLQMDSIVNAECRQRQAADDRTLAQQARVRDSQALIEFLEPGSLAQ